MKSPKKCKIKAATQVRVMNIMQLNRGGISLAFHNQLCSHAGRCTQTANNVANSQMQIILN